MSDDPTPITSVRDLSECDRIVVSGESVSFTVTATVMSLSWPDFAVLEDDEGERRPLREPSAGLGMEILTDPAGGWIDVGIERLDQ